MFSNIDDPVHVPPAGEDQVPTEEVRIILMDTPVIL